MVIVDMRSLVAGIQHIQPDAFIVDQLGGVRLTQHLLGELQGILHASVEHIFFNMFALWMFGRTLEYELGSKRFLIYYMVCGVGAALIQLATAYLTGEMPIQLVGASGAVMGLLLAFGVMHPNAVIMLLIPPIPMKAKWFVVIYGVIELFLGWTGFGGNVAHFAHVGGMLWGLLLLQWWKRNGTIRF